MSAAAKSRHDISAQNLVGGMLVPSPAAALPLSPLVGGKDGAAASG